MRIGVTEEFAVSEGDGCSGEHSRVNPELMKRLTEQTDRSLALRGTTVDRILDPECYGTPLEKFRARAERFFSNLPMNLRFLGLWF